MNMSPEKGPFQNKTRVFNKYIYIYFIPQKNLHELIPEHNRGMIFQPPKNLDLQDAWEKIPNIFPEWWFNYRILKGGGSKGRG